MTTGSNVVPLLYASLCLDCEVITSVHTFCPACGSGALMNLARALGHSKYNDLRPRVGTNEVGQVEPLDRPSDVGPRNGWRSPEKLPFRFRREDPADRARTSSSSFSCGA